MGGAPESPNLRWSRINRRTLAWRALAGGLAAGGSARLMPSRAQTPVSGGGTLRIGHAAPDSGLGIPILDGAVRSYLGEWVFARLLRVNQLGALVADLATRWDYNVDATELGLTLNQGALWHDGQPVTSADVVFTLGTIASHPATRYLRQLLTIDGEFVGWSAPSSTQVRLHLPRPHAPLLSSLAEVPIVPRHRLEASPDLLTDPFNLTPVGSGPFMVSAWSAGQHVRYQPFASSHYAHSPLAAVEERFFPNVGEVAAAFARDELDLAMVGSMAVAGISADPAVRVIPMIFPVPVSLSFNMKHPQLMDGNLRQVFRLAIDKAVIARTITGDLANRADNQFAIDGPFAYLNDRNLPPVRMDLVWAEALLDQLDYDRGLDGVRSGAAGRLSFPLLVPAEIPEYLAVAELVRDQLAPIGIECVPTPTERAVLAQRWMDPMDDPLTRPLTIEEYPHPAEYDADLFAELHSASFPPNGRNYNFAHDDAIDRLIEDGHRVDEDERIVSYRLLDGRRHTVIPTLSLYRAIDHWLCRDAVAGIPEPVGMFRWFLRSGVAHLSVPVGTS